MKTLKLTAIFALLWWLLTNGSVQSWLIGLPVIVAAAWISQSLKTRTTPAINVQGLISFMAFFIYESLRGGIDVARRILTLKMRIQPHFYRYQANIELPLAKVMFCNCISLLPGTLCARVRKDEIEIHALSSDTEVEKELKQLEHKVLNIFKQTGDNNE